MKRSGRPVAPVIHLDPERTTFEHMLERYSASMRSRQLAHDTVSGRVWTVKRFQAFTGEYPWHWTPADIEDFTSSLLSKRRPLAHSTLRGYQAAIKGFCDFLTNPAYDWHEVCLERFGAVPSQICNPWNTFAHVAEFEAKPSRRPLGYDELTAFFEYADGQAERLIDARAKGALPALRDAQLFKTAYAFGLRRRETVMLDLHDLRPSSFVPEWGNYARLQVRFGKAMKGSPPRRRTVLALPEFEWAIEGLRTWVEEVRPRLAHASGAALWPSERGTRLGVRSVDDRFARIRDAVGLDPALTMHSLRHSYVTHLIELGYAERFVQEQVGHYHSSTTALYTSVSDDYRNRMLQEALDRVWVAKRGTT